MIVAMLNEYVGVVVFLRVCFWNVNQLKANDWEQLPVETSSEVKLSTSNMRIKFF